ncbi:ribonuclease H-like domain-containing protein [Tanacetum coccineum]
MRNNIVDDDVNVTSDTDHLTFFDNQVSQSLNDERRASSIVDGSGSSSRTDTALQYSEGNTTTQVDDNSSYEGNVPSILNVFPNQPAHTVDIDRDQPNIRRSSRPSKLPAKLTDYVIDSKLRYGIEKHVNYANLNSVNYSFTTTLNKSVDHVTYYDVIKDNNWIEAMNIEIEALNRNNTWTVTDLLAGRKAIGYKWLYKIKYKVSDETFSPVLDVNNAFLYGDLSEEQAKGSGNAKLLLTVVKLALTKKTLIILSLLTQYLSLCGTQADSHEHLFFECSYSSKVWSLIRGLVGMDGVPPVLENIIAWFQPLANKRTVQNIVGKILIAAATYFIWLERNNRLFKRTRRSPEDLRDAIVITVRLKLVSFRFKNKEKVRNFLSLWKMPTAFRFYGKVV